MRVKPDIILLVSYPWPHPIALGTLAPWGDLRIWLAGVQGSHHPNPRQHGRAAALGDQEAALGPPPAIPVLRARPSEAS